MKILMIVPYFVPEIGSAAHVYFDLALAFIKREHEVDIITSYPRKFNLNESEKNKTFPLFENIEGIGVYRCLHPVIRDNLIIRGLEHFYLPYLYLRKYRENKKKYDICLIYIPPLPLYYFAKNIKKLDNTSSILNIQDFHPQELTDVGIMKNPILIKIMNYIEGQLLKNADFITVLSHGGIKYVEEKGATREKVRHIYNSINPEIFKDFLSQKDFKQKEGIENKFLISYAGILSPFQGIDNIVNVALKLKDNSEFIFYIVGDGIIRKKIENRIISERITNIQLLKFLPRNEYFNLINSSDISLVSLDERMKAPCLPGKIIYLMAAKQPILAIVSNDSETARVIKEANCGITVKPSDIEKLMEMILFLRENSSYRILLGENGRKFLEKNMNLYKNVQLYEEIFKNYKYSG